MKAGFAMCLWAGSKQPKELPPACSECKTALERLAVCCCELDLRQFNIDLICENLAYAPRRVVRISHIEIGAAATTANAGPRRSPLA